ncbi:MAG: hypothetical protein PHO56_01850 [Patescibacteria group bacterium]|nr:hypothetical protein [Patescibacteria group bacterium]
MNRLLTALLIIIGCTGCGRDSIINQNGNEQLSAAGIAKIYDSMPTIKWDTVKNNSDTLLLSSGSLKNLWRNRVSEYGASWLQNVDVFCGDKKIDSGSSNGSSSFANKYDGQKIVIKKMTYPFVRGRGEIFQVDERFVLYKISDASIVERDSLYCLRSSDLTVVQCQ